MSRIGKQPVLLPPSVTVSKEADMFTVIGPKGSLQVAALPGVEVEQAEGKVLVSASSEETRSYQGLLRTLLHNAATGVAVGWKKELELNGVGMRAALNGSTLNLSLGFSHPVLVPAPQGITFEVAKNLVTVSGIDKQLVGETAAQIRKLRKPEPYKGKGIRYTTEYVRRKAGKTGKAGK